MAYCIYFDEDVLKLKLASVVEVWFGSEKMSLF